MDEYIADSGDEGVGPPVLNSSRRHNKLVFDEERIISDSDDEIYHYADQPVIPQATPAAQPRYEDPKPRFGFGRRSTLTGGAKANKPKFGRRMVSSVVAEKQKAEEEAIAAQAALEQEKIELEPSRHQPPSQQSLPQSAKANFYSAPSFVGRQPLQPIKPLPDFVPKSSSAQDTTRSNGAETSGALNAQVKSQTTTAAAAPAQSSQPVLLGGGSSELAGLANRSAGTAGPSLASYKTNDGVNVVINKRKRAANDNEGGPATKQKASVNTGWGNNFVRIDLKKGKGSTKFRASRHNYSRRRPGRGRWKTQRLRQVGDGSEFMEGWESRGGSTCFKCGGKGHWAKDCPGLDGPDEDFGSESGNDLPGARKLPSHPSLPPLPTLPEGCMPLSPLPAASIELDIDVEALCDVDALVTQLQDKFGFSAFRGLQMDTIRKVIRGESCLSIMPTGMGKSLCYQLPALLLPGLTLVISPLIALMHDQCKTAPKDLNPAVLWSGQTPMDARMVLRDVESGATRLLFISPERLGNPYLLAALRPRMPLSLVVVDEAHCVAEWGHSFRPAYFRLGEALQRDISTRSVLALTATATKATEAAVCHILRLPKTEILRDGAIRENLRLHVLRSQGTPAANASSGSRAGWQHIINLYKGGALKDSKSSIIYCAWKGDADSLASALVTSGVNAKAYHAGRNLQERSNIEAAFAARRLRVVVATVAFGMGIDIASVDAVVHATMPRSLEEYVQQIGRAGRDGSIGHCYAHLADKDFISLRSLAYSGMVTKESVAKVISKVFSGIAEDDEAERQFGSIDCRKLANEVDMQEESIETILGYLEADEDPYVRVLPKVAMLARVSFYAASPEDLAGEHPVVRAVLAACPRPRNGLYSVPTAKLAVAVQKTPGAALQDLQALAQQKLIGFEFGSDKGAAFEILREPENESELAESIFARLSVMLRCQVARLDTAYRSFAVSASKTTQEEREASLREALEEYFSRQEAAGLAGGGITDPCAALELNGLPLREAPAAMLQAAKAVLRRNKEQGGASLAPMAVARVLHGTGTVAMPRDSWSKRMGEFWGKFKDVDFTVVVRTCTIACRSFN